MEERDALAALMKDGEDAAPADVVDAGELRCGQGLGAEAVAPGLRFEVEARRGLGAERAEGRGAARGEGGPEEGRGTPRLSSTEATKAGGAPVVTRAAGAGFAGAALRASRWGRRPARAGALPRSSARVRAEQTSSRRWYTGPPTPLCRLL